MPIISDLLTRLRPRSAWIAAVTVAISLARSPVTAQDLAAGRIDALVRDAAQRFAQGQTSGAPSSAAPQQALAPLSLTVDEAGKLALDKNLDIAVQRSSPLTYDLALARLKSAYLPSVSSLIGDNSQVATPITLLTGGQRVTTTTGTVNGSLNQNVPWAGGNLNVTWDNNRLFTNSILYNYNPAFNATLTAQYTQPLLRGLHTDAARQQTFVTRVNRAISDLQLQTTITNTLSAVRDAYWDLVFAAQSIVVAQKSVELAHDLLEDNQRRVDVGAMTRLDLITAQSQEATSQHALVQAEGNRRTAELALKRLLVSGPTDPLWQTPLDPTDSAEDTFQPIDIEAAVRRALAIRTDLAEANQQAIANQRTLDYLRDQGRPQADLVATYGLAGLGGTQLLRPTATPSNFFTAPVEGTIPGSYGGALSNILGRDYPTWGIALNVSYRIGLNAAKAEAARAAIQQKQVETQTRQLEVQVVTDVTNAAIQVRNNADQVATAKLARELAEQKLDAEQKKFASGVSTTYLVVQAQKDLADAETTELQSEVGYRKSVVDFERSQQTTLQAAGVTIISPAGLDNPPAVGSGRPAEGAPTGAFIP